MLSDHRGKQHLSHSKFGIKADRVTSTGFEFHLVRTNITKTLTKNFKESFMWLNREDKSIHLFPLPYTGSYESLF